MEAISVPWCGAARSGVAVQCGAVLFGATLALSVLPLPGVPRFHLFHLAVLLAGKVIRRGTHFTFRHHNNQHAYGDRSQG